MLLKVMLQTKLFRYVEVQKNGYLLIILYCYYYFYYYLHEWQWKLKINHIYSWNLCNPHRVINIFPSHCQLDLCIKISIRVWLWIRKKEKKERKKERKKKNIFGYYINYKLKFFWKLINWFFFHKKGTLKCHPKLKKLTKIHLWNFYPNINEE